MKVEKRQAALFISLFWVIIYISKFFQDMAAARLQGFKNNYLFTLFYQVGWLFWIPLTFLTLKISRAHPIHRSGFAKSFVKHFLFVATAQGIDYVLKFQNVTIKNLNLEAKLFESQNQALKMQIQPHFLFN